MFGSIIYFVEFDHKSTTEFESIVDACWWAIVSLTTTGYGDMAPRTALGKVVGAITAVSSIIIIVLPVPSIVSHFMHFCNEDKDRKAAQKKSKMKKQ